MPGYNISKEDLKRYFYAIEKNSIDYNIDIQYSVVPQSKEYKETLEELKEILERKLAPLGHKQEQEGE